MLPYPCAAVYRFSTSIKYCDSARRRRLLDGINLRSVERGESRGPRVEGENSRRKEEGPRGERKWKRRYTWLRMEFFLEYEFVRSESFE